MVFRYRTHTDRVPGDTFSGTAAAVRRQRTPFDRTGAPEIPGGPARNVYVPRTDRTHPAAAFECTSVPSIETLRNRASGIPPGRTNKTRRFGFVERNVSLSAHEGGKRFSPETGVIRNSVMSPLPTGRAYTENHAFNELSKTAEVSFPNLVNNSFVFSKCNGFRNNYEGTFFVDIRTFN